MRPVDLTLSSTLRKAEGSKRSRPARRGGDGGLIWRSANGGPSGKTTAPTGKLGHSFRSSMRVVAPIVGERMASRDSATRLCAGASAWRFGMARTPFSKNAFLGWAVGKGTTVKTSKRSITLWTLLRPTPTKRWSTAIRRIRFPYAELVSVNKLRSRQEPEFELVDTGIFSGARFFDVTIEYAKADPDDILILVSIENAARESAVLHVLPQLWARNTWSWNGAADRPRLRKAGPARCARILARQEDEALEPRLLR